MYLIYPKLFINLIKVLYPFELLCDELCVPLWLKKLTTKELEGFHKGSQRFMN